MEEKAVDAVPGAGESVKRYVVRAAALLLLLALAALGLWLEEIRFILAGLAIACLAELALALRARRHRPQAPGDRSRISAAQVSCTERDGALTVTLTGEHQGRAGAPYLLLSRPLRTAQAASAMEDRPYLELSDRSCSIHGSIQDAYLSPQVLRLTLDPRGAEVLGASQLCVTLQQGNDQRRLERALSRILRGVPFTSERSMPEDEAEMASSPAP